MDPTEEAFTAEVLQTHSKRFIAALLGDLESFSGRKDPERSRVVKDYVNTCVRALYTRLTNTQVESVHD